MIKSINSWRSDHLSLLSASLIRLREWWARFTPPSSFISLCTVSTLLNIWIEKIRLLDWYTNSYYLTFLLSCLFNWGLNVFALVAILFFNFVIFSFFLSFFPFFRGGVSKFKVGVQSLILYCVYSEMFDRQLGAPNIFALRVH